MPSHESLTSALTLYWHLQACYREGVAPPESTKHITCDEHLISYLAESVLAVEGQSLARDAVAGAYLGLPVKQVFALTPYALRIDDLMERDFYLRRKASKRAA